MSADERCGALHPSRRPRRSRPGLAGEAVAAERPYAHECRLRMKDGSYRAFRVRAVPRRDESGRIVRWHGISEDVEEQKEAERARRDVEERYRLAAMATNDAIWDSDLIADVDRLERQCRGDPRQRHLASGPHSGRLVDRPHPSRRQGRRAAELPGGDRGRRQALVRDLSLPARRRRLCRHLRPRLHHPRRGRAGGRARSARWPTSPSATGPRPRSGGCRRS